MTTVEEVSETQNQPGVYRHPETGAEVVVERHPKFGNAKADGLARVGFVFDRPAPVKTQDLRTQPDEKVGTSDEDLGEAEDAAKEDKVGTHAKSTSNATKEGKK